MNVIMLYIIVRGIWGGNAIYEPISDSVVDQDGNARKAVRPIDSGTTKVRQGSNVLREQDISVICERNYSVAADMWVLSFRSHRQMRRVSIITVY